MGKARRSACAVTSPMRAHAKAGRARTAVKVCLLLVAAGVAFLVALLGRAPFSQEPLELRFLYYTNNAVQERIALMEITNRSTSAYEWKLGSDAKPANHNVAVSDLMETNGELRAVSPYNGGNLFEYDALRFGTDDFQPGKRLWVSIQHYPPTRVERWRAAWSSWLERRGFRRLAPTVRQGRRINGPVLPPDRP